MLDVEAVLAALHALEAVICLAEGAAGPDAERAIGLAKEKIRTGDLYGAKAVQLVEAAAAKLETALHQA